MDMPTKIREVWFIRRQLSHITLLAVVLLVLFGLLPFVLPMSDLRYIKPLSTMMVGASTLAALAIWVFSLHPLWHKHSSQLFIMSRSFWLVGLFDLLSIFCNDQQSIWFWLGARLWFTCALSMLVVPAYLVDRWQRPLTFIRTAFAIIFITLIYRQPYLLPPLINPENTITMTAAGIIFLIAVLNLITAYMLALDPNNNGTSDVKGLAGAALLATVDCMAPIAHHHLGLALMSSRFSNTLALALTTYVMFSLAITVTNRQISTLYEQVRQGEQLSMLAFFCCRLAHDLRNPITVMRANAQLGQMRAANTPIATLFDRIITQADTLTEIVNAKLPITFSNGVAYVFDMNKLAATVANMWVAEAAVRSLQMDVNLAPTPLLVKARYTLIQQAFHNVILNAIQASGTHGHLILNVDSTSKEAIFSVRDTGIGIPYKIQNEVFTEFFTTKENAAGLGLSVSQDILRNEGGRIWFTTQPGQGSNFYISLPLWNYETTPVSANSDQR